MKKGLIVIILCFLVLLATLLVYKNIYNNEKPKEKKENDDIIEVSNNNFNLKLLKIVNKDNSGNYLISPYSIEIALQMLRSGADGKTLEEINSLINSRDIKPFNVQKYISVANAMFIRNYYKDVIEKEFYNNIQNQYRADMIYDEFSTPDKINSWVNEKTYEMIPSILDEISQNFVLGIANAVAIDVEWNSTFSCESTYSEEFINSNGKINVEMMHKNYEYNVKYFENDKRKGVIIPYKTYENEDGSEVSLEFIGILPNENIKNFINNLKEEDLLFNDAKDLDNKELNLSLPRFKYEYTLENFKEVLIDLGIKDAFVDNKADFTKMISRENMYKKNIENLYVNKAIHKTYIELSESGTKAAAVTYFGLEKSNAVSDPKEQLNIKFNKPFMYIIREKNTNELLFIGVVETPNEWVASTCSE